MKGFERMTVAQIAPMPASEVAPRATATLYPKEFAERVAGRIKRRLGDHFGISSFGVNLTELPPGCQSALLHRHTQQEEFVYILSGVATLCTGAEQHQLSTGSCVGFLPTGPAHHLVNLSDQNVLYLEIGDRLPGDAAEYPQDDLVAEMTATGWEFRKRDGTLWSDRETA
jgi:uncharacterized cupin superfamily protein